MFGKLSCGCVVLTISNQRAILIRPCDTDSGDDNTLDFSVTAGTKRFLEKGSEVTPLGTEEEIELIEEIKHTIWDGHSFYRALCALDITNLKYRVRKLEEANNVRA